MRRMEKQQPTRKVVMCFDLHTVDHALAVRRITPSGWKRAEDVADPPPDSLGHYRDDKGHTAFLVNAGDYRGGPRLFLIVYEPIAATG